MAKPTRRQQAEALGWRFTAIPTHWEAGQLWHDPRTGERSPAFSDFKSPAGWLATPPEGHPVPPRRFDHRSPALAVRWALQQAAAPALDASLGGVAGLAALMGAAAVAGAVSDAAEACSVLPKRPDAELLALCRDIAACERQIEAARDGWGPAYVDRQAHALNSARLHDAHRERDRLVPLVAEMRPTTPAGLVAKAAVVAGLFERRRGPASRAAELLAEDIAGLLGGRDEAPAGPVKP